MTSLPRVSIAIPVRDRLTALELVLRFFNYQTYPHERFEVIVVDDGSGDAVRDALSEAGYDFQLTIIRQVNCGRAAARNRAVERSSGDLIVFCDADRIPDPDFIAAHVRFQQRHPGAAAFGCPWDCFYAGQRLRACSDADVALIRRFSRRPDYYKTIVRLFDPESTSSTIAWVAFLMGNSSLPRRAFEAAGGCDERFTTWGFEHFELALRLQDEGTAIRHNAAAANYHVPHDRGPDVDRDIRTSMDVFAGLHPRRNVRLLERFLRGAISLQEFEVGFGAAVTETIAGTAPIYLSRPVPNCAAPSTAQTLGT